MAGAFVRETGHLRGNTGNLTAPTSHQIPVTASSGAGNTLILCFTGDVVDAVIGNWHVTDSKGNTWTVDFVSAAVAQIVIASTRQDVGTLASGVDSITVSNSASHGFGCWVMWVEEFSGLLAASYIDKTATAHRTTPGTTLTVGPTATTTAADMVLAFFVSGDAITFTKDAAFTAFPSGSDNTTNGSSGDSASAMPAYKLAPTLGTQSATFTSGSTTSEGAIVTYKYAPVVNTMTIAVAQASTTKITKRIGNPISVTQGSTVKVIRKIGNPIALVQGSVVKVRKQVTQPRRLGQSTTTTVRRLVTQSRRLVQPSVATTVKQVGHKVPKLTQASSLLVSLLHIVGLPGLAARFDTTSPSATTMGGTPTANTFDETHPGATTFDEGNSI